MNPRLAAVLLSLSVALACTASCRSRPPAALPPVPLEASLALREGYLALQVRPERASEGRAALERAVELAPDWVAPRRLLDEIERNDLRGVEVLRGHVEALEFRPRDAGELYLAGRLEGLDGTRRFEEAVRVAPRLAWGHHGLAWAAAARGNLDAAVEHARDALALARDPYERTFFTTTLARHLVADDQRDAALEVLDARARATDVSAEEHATIAALSVQFALEAPSMRVRNQAYERGLEVLRSEELSDADVEDVVPRMRGSLAFEDVDGSRLSLALAARPGASRERLRAEQMLDAASTPLALGLYERALERQGRAAPAGALVRSGRFAAGDFALAVERWRSDLPHVVLAPDGLPRDERLARVVRAARALPAAHGTLGGRAELVELGDALIAAGWFREARSVATHLGALDLESALALENRALAGVDLLESLRRTMRRVDRAASARATTPAAVRDEPRSARVDAAPQNLASIEEPPPLRSLDALLDALAPIFAHAGVFLGEETDVDALRCSIRASPRMKYAGVAELVHPGPRLSKDDERDELGRAGEAVTGLAPLFARFGRFALFGEMSGGGGPDASVLPLLGYEERSGEHLGVRWHGTVAWCESADVKSRAGRRGAQISAAALHEGYWVDIDSVREEQAAWKALRRRFVRGEVRERDPAEEERISAVLASRGLALADARSESERLTTSSLLGEAQRVRLAVLRDRAEPGASLGQMTLDELVAVTATHEEGHLCDRTRFLPLWDHKLAAFGLLLDCQFSPTRVGEELEYRAQLTCMTAIADPRIALAQVLDAAEGGLSGLTPHAKGYARLLTDLLRVLDLGVRRDAPEFTSIRAEFTLAHQLHKVSPDELRRAAVTLARSKGM